MGQRSQIYVRIHNEDAPAASEMKEYLIANYYQWNFADRMVSRLRNFVERMEAETYFIMDEEHYQKYNGTLVKTITRDFYNESGGCCRCFQ